ncbi:uncharacterized protein LOC119332839 [Triticum dicoccoides]|uniref:uncharacterized protein LOC119332839 n=1 Tax=Triticum dicoccoides TaxID=85692 RepID=UPI0018911564|nr:uncharacterized protein LOC119332839 [Triticum dicoccoides]XP_044428169.1 uncharacterized protein LOC123152791 [Triticum aestivum]
MRSAWFNTSQDLSTTIGWSGQGKQNDLEGEKEGAGKACTAVVGEAMLTGGEAGHGGDKRSSHAKDLRDLSLVAVDILKIRVAAAGGKVKEALQKDKKGTEEALGLRYCQVDYDVTIGTLDLCDAMLRDFHVPRGDADCLWSFELPECVEKATDHVSDCWHDLHMDSQPLINENKELIKLGDLNNVLLGPYDFDS